MWRVSGTRKCLQHMDATYLPRRLVGLRRTLTTRRWSLGTGCDEDIGGQTRADFFKSLHESAKSAFSRLFADFVL